MIDEIKKLICDHGDQIFPYLKLRSRHRVGNHIVVEKDFISDEEISDLCVSGYVRLDSDDGSLLTITLADGDRWLYQPITYKPKRKPVKKYRNRDLESVAELVGFPIDWITKESKYLSLFFKLKREYGIEMILKVAKYASESHPEVGLEGFFTRNWFKSLKYNMDRPSKGKKDVVGRESESNYTRGQSFLKLHEKYNYINLPKQYWDCTYDQIQEVNLPIVDPWKLENIKDRLSGKGMFLFGKYGRGKGGICAVIAKWGLAYGVFSYWLNFSDLVPLHMKDDPYFSESMTVLDRIKSVDLLIIDEFQLIKAKNGTINWSIKFLEDLLRSRVNQRKPTIMASNHSPDLLVKKFGGDAEGLIAFMPDAFDVKLVDGKDLRRKK